MPKQTLEEWLAERRTGIGGSDAAAVLSEGYGCPRALFLDKSGVEPDYQYGEVELGLFERGHALEPIIARKFTQATGMKVRRMPSRVSAERPWMRVNVDRCIETIDPAEGPGYLECKTANQHVFQNMLEEGMPNHYVLQVQHGLAVTGWKWGCFAVLEPYTFRFMQFRYERNESLIAVLQQAEEAFWREVQAGNIPNKLEEFNDQRCEKCVYRRGCRNAEALPAKKKVKPVYVPDENEDLARLVAGLKAIDIQVEDLEIARDELRDGIKAMLGDRTHVLVPSQGIKLNLGTQSGRYMWDGKALDAEHPELAAKYKRRGEPFQVLRMYDASEVEGKAEALKEVA